MTQLATKPKVPLESRHMRLVPPTVGFADELFRAASVGEVPWLWRDRPVTPEGFRASLFDGALAQFAVQDRRSGQLVGYVCAYDANHVHRYAYMTILLLPDFQRRVWPLEATVLFANYLFVRFNLRNLYGRSADENFAQARSGAGLFFELEGCLKDHLIVDGAPQDLHLLTVSRERWDEVGLPLLDRITR